MAAATAAATRGGGGGGGEEEKTKKRKISSLDSSFVAAPTSSSKSTTLRESLRALDASLRSKLDSISEKLVLTSSSDAAATTTSFKAPSSLTSAIGDAQEKQQLEERQKGEEKQKKGGGGGSSKDKVKNKQDYLQDEMQPWVKPVGASLADPEQGPFIAWCEEHFREVTMADAKKLIPSTSQPRLEEDPDFCTLPEKERSYYEGARSILFFFFKMCFFSSLSLFQISVCFKFTFLAGVSRAMDRSRWQIVKLMID